MPSSHAQFVAFFSVYITLWMFLRNRHLTPAYRYGLSTLALTAAICISLSRVYLSYHTPKQVLAGTSVGVLLGITWYLFTGFVRSTPLRFAGRRVWEWVMWFGGFLWAKDMCLDVDLVEHDWNVWNSRVNGVSGNSKVKVR